MSDRSEIEWTDATWNPVRGCTKISPGCAHCYAAVFAERWRGVSGHPYEHGFDPRLVPEKLGEPFTWAGPRRVFVNSMSDLFHDVVTDEYLDRVFDVMETAEWHTFQVLTKRAARMRNYVTKRYLGVQPPENVWLGVSVENRAHGLPRIEELRHTPAHVRFLSIEPLIESVGGLDLDGIHWVIVGGESGPGAREMKPSWVKAIRARCKADSVPFFFKQWGGTQKSRTGRTLDGRTWDDAPPSPKKRAPTAPERARLVEAVHVSSRSA